MDLNPDHKQKYNEYRYKDEYKNYRIHSEDKSLINKIIQDNNKKEDELHLLLKECSMYK